MNSRAIEDRWDMPIGATEAPTERSGKPRLVHYLEMARRHLWLIGAILAASLVAGLVLTMLATPQFTAGTRIEIARQQANVTNVEGIQSEKAGQDQEFYATQYALLNARSLAERVARRLRLARNDAFFDAHGVEPAGAAAIAGTGQSGLNSARLGERQRMVANLLLGNVTITPIRGSSLVDVKYTSASPQLSADIANAWVQEFIQQSMDRRFSSTADARNFLENRLSTLRQRLEQSERDLVNYADRRGIVRLGERETQDGRTRTTQTLASADLEALNQALIEATAARVTAEGRMDAATASRASNEALTNPAINALRQRRAELAAQYAELMVRFEPEYPAALALRQQMTVLDRSIATEERRVRESFGTEYQAARAREEDLRRRVDAMMGRLSTENRASIQYNIFQREVDTNRQLYEALLQRYKEIGVAGVGTNNIAVVDQALPPTGPSSPNLMLNLLLALVAGSVLAALATLVLENLSEGLRDPQQVGDVLGVPLLGAIPDAGDGLSIEQVQDPKTHMAEAYMTVRTNLGFSTDHGVPKTLAITSAAPAEGKSTSSFALAMVLARTGKRVALIDVDLRRPSMARNLGLSGDAGVSNYLSGDDNWQQLLQPTAIENVLFISAGPTPPSAADLLAGDRLARLVNELAAAFDHVIVDAPPMLGLSDAPLIARVVEGMIYVIEAERTSARAAQAALARLRESRARVLGAIMTKYRAKRTGYGYGYGYGYGHDDADRRGNGN